MISIQASLDYREVVKLINIEIDEAGTVDDEGEGGDPYVVYMGVNRYRLADFHTLVPLPSYANAIPSGNVYETDLPNTRVVIQDSSATPDNRNFSIDLESPVLIDTFEMLEIS